jgi:hypothetical protein
MRTVDKTLILPRINMLSQYRTEEKTFSSFISVYRRWVEIQRIIYKSKGKSLPTLPRDVVKTNLSLILYQDKFSLVPIGNVKSFLSRRTHRLIYFVQNFRVLTFKDIFLRYLFSYDDVRICNSLG